MLLFSYCHGAKWQSFYNICESVTVQNSSSCWLIVLDNNMSRGEKAAAKKKQDSNEKYTNNKYLRMHWYT